MRSFLPAFCTFTFLALNVFSASSAEPRVARAVAAASEVSGTGNSSSVVLRPNDVFELRLNGMPPEDSAQFNGTQTVGSDGYINILYAGRIQAAGRTAAQLERAIEKELVDKKIFRWPAAVINIATGLRYVTVGGRVRQSNRIQWSAELTILTVLMQAGGPDDFASDKVSLVRDGKRIVYSYKKLRRDPSEDQKVLPNDSIEML